MLVRRLARPMLASWYVHDGLDAVRTPAPHVAVARPVADRVTSALGRPPVPERTLTWAVRAHGAATIVAGLGLALGRAPRSSAAALAALTLPLAVAQQPMTSPRSLDKSRLTPFVHALGGLGAAVLTAVDLEGRPGVAWRVDKARRDRADRTPLDG
ncbi:DoxX family membrane protein [Sanguibacter sp. A247]|uniref:DoxX family membrane protein n=1 Tax=unclassified Sanguibacter TaxID=2645534 RepID=UPI003FD7DA86